MLKPPRTFSHTLIQISFGILLCRYCFLAIANASWQQGEFVSHLLLKGVNLPKPHHFPTLLVFAWVIWVWLIAFPTNTNLCTTFSSNDFSASSIMILTYIEQNYIQSSTQRRQPSSPWGSHLCKNFRKQIFHSEVSPTASRKKNNSKHLKCSK